MDDDDTDNSEIITLSFCVGDPESLARVALAAYMSSGNSLAEARDYLLHEDGTPNTERCLREVLCEASLGKESRIGNHAHEWEFSE